MRYDDMKKLYPGIDDMIAWVTDQIHARWPVDITMQFVELRIGAEIDKRHRRVVTERLVRWAHLVEENMLLFPLPDDAPPLPLPDESPTLPSPVLCIVCGSIDTSGESCRWCHEKSAGHQTNARSVIP